MFCKIHLFILTETCSCPKRKREAKIQSLLVYRVSLLVSDLWLCKCACLGRERSLPQRLMGWIKSGGPESDLQLRQLYTRWKCVCVCEKERETGRRDTDSKIRKWKRERLGNEIRAEKRPSLEPCEWWVTGQSGQTHVRLDYFKCDWIAKQHNSAEQQIMTL